LEIEKAWKQGSMGQHEGALRTVDALIVANSENPEVYGRKAELLIAMGRPAEAEVVLDKAFALRADYPFGNYLKASLRLEEGEINGGLILARKAADACHPSATGPLVKIFSLIFDAEQKLNHPLAARSALKTILRLQPNSPEPKALFEELYGEGSPLPEAARREYSLLPPPSVAARRVAWDKAAKAHGGPRLSSLIKVFEEVTQGDQNDAPAWFNLALAHAWIGQNQKSLDALDRYLSLETDENRATMAVALGEVLRIGKGMEEKTDHYEMVFETPIRDPRALAGFLQKLMDEGRFRPFQKNEEEQLISGILFKPQSSLVLAGGGSAGPSQIAGFMIATPFALMVRTRFGKFFEEIRNEVKTALGLAITDGQTRKQGTFDNPFFHHTAVLPAGENADTKLMEKTAEGVKNWLLNEWVESPLKTLSGKSPRQALESREGRARVLGLFKFFQGFPPLVENFEALLEEVKAAIGLAAKKAEPPKDAGTTSTPAASTEGADLDRAFKEARRHDNDEEAAALAAKIVAMGPESLPDRSAAYLFLGKRAMAAGSHQEAVDLLKRGVEFDKLQNQGSKSGELRLSLAQAVAKSGKPDEAVGLILESTTQEPTNLSLGARGVETLLAIKRPKEAMDLATRVKSEAVHQQNRDAEGHMAELIEVAGRQLNG